jgi:hypothetical protein
MDNLNNVGSVAGIVSLISGIIYGIIRLVSHSHCKSMCCGQVASIDVDMNTPTYKDLPAPTEKLTRQSQLNETKNEP